MKHRFLFSAVIFLTLLALAFSALGFTPAYAAGATIFNYTGAEQTYVVPAGACTVTVDAYGAKGGTGRTSGGYGKRVQATIPVTPSETLYIFIGEEGGYGDGGFNGGGNGGYGYYGSGGGGGASDVRQGGNALTNRVIVAAGGGGGGGGGRMYGYGGYGGDGDSYGY